MNANVKTSLVLSHRVWERLLSMVSKADGKYEVGGLLMGICKHHRHIVIDITEPDINIDLCQGSFVLDGEYHSKMASDIIKASTRNVDVIGMWHSHGTIPLHFSEADKSAHKYLAQCLGGCSVSLLCACAEILYLKAIEIDNDANTKEAACTICISNAF